MNQRQQPEVQQRDSGQPRAPQSLHQTRGASLLLKAGIPPKIVSERLGHASVAFTMEIYAHVIPGMQAEAAQLFHDLVFGDAEPDHPCDDGDGEDETEGNG